MPATVKITREEADLLLTALKVKKASSQTDEWVAKQLNKLADNLSQDQMDKVTDEEAKEVLDKVMEALADDHEIVLGGDGDEDEDAEVDTDADDEGDEEEEVDTDEEDAGDEEEEPKPKPKAKGKAKGGKKPAAKTPTKPVAKPAAKKGGKPATAKPAAKKGPGVIDTVIEQLQKATKKNPVLKDAIHTVLVKRFPDRDPASMKATLNAQVPTGLKTEKNIDVGAVDTPKGRGYYIQSLNGWKPRSAK